MAAANPARRSPTEAPLEAGLTERGLTLVELLVTVAILGVVLASLLGVLDSLTKNEQSTQALVANQEQVRLAMLEIARDVRSANPLLGQSTVQAYATQLSARIGPSDGPQSTVQWRLGGATLFRDILGADGAVSSSRTVLTNVRNADLGLDLFAYYTSDGTRLDTSASSTAAPGDFTNCTVRVRIQLASGPEPGSVPFQEHSDVELRNSLPGGPGCTP